MITLPCTDSRHPLQRPKNAIADSNLDELWFLTHVRGSETVASRGDHQGGRSRRRRFFGGCWCDGDGPGVVQDKDILID